ncbi:MAG: hypothetical protein IPL59_26870 [Candidatus Competibacteraceae bacterium]|nr:hypothetical protein [Candidatus Competibacteraceae bacterium]
MLETLRELKTMGVTVVIVSHKPSVLKDVDKLLVLNQGRQVHHGPRAAILKLSIRDRPGSALNPDADETRVSRVKPNLARKN